MCSAYASCLECTGATLHDGAIEQLVQLDVPSAGSVDFVPPPARIEVCGAVRDLHMISAAIES